MARKAEQGALQYAVANRETNPPRIGGAGFIAGVLNDFLINPRNPFNRLTAIGRWLGYFWDNGVSPLSLNFADGSNTLDSRITFSRSSNATVTDSSGNIVYAPHNLLSFASQFDNAAWTKTTTTVTANSTVAPSGQTTADTLTSGGANSTTLHSYTAVATPYVFSVYIKRRTGTGNIQITADGTTYETVAVTSNWTRFSTTVTPTAGTRTPGIRIVTSGDAIDVWGSQLNVGSLQPFYTTTVMNLLGFSEAFDNAAWTKSNSFIQTNLLTFSEQYTNAVWAKTTTTITANTELSPTGTLTADTLTATGTNSTMLQTFTASAVAYTFSVWLKRKTGTGNVDITVDGTTYATQTINSTSWTRCTITTTPSAGSRTAGVRIATNGDEVFAWGAQLVQGASAGDYVQTTSTALPVMYQAPNGTMTADKLVETTATNFHQMLSGTVAVISGTIYNFSIYAKQSERRYLTFNASSAFFGTQDFCIYDLQDGVITQQGTSGTASITPVGNGWFRCSRTLTATSSGNSVAAFGISDSATGGRAPSYTGDGTSGIYIWGAQLSDSASLDTYVNNPVAAPSSTAYYGPRFDYDPVTKQPKGLLIEESRVNLLLNSSIDGTSLATQSITTTAAARTLSFYGTGTVVLSGTHSATVVGTGAYPTRTTYTYTPTAGTLTLTVSGTVQFAQDELGAFATSFIPTAGTSVTRAADVAVIQGSNFSSWYKYDEGTLFAEFQRFYAAASYFPRILSVGVSGSNNDAIEFTYSSPNDQFAITAGGSAQGPIIVANGGTALNKISGAYALNNAASSLNGATVVTDTSSLVPTVSQMRIGDRQDGLRPYSGWIRRINYYNRRLNNSQLQAITQ